MATDWKSKYGDGKWVTIRGARVYVQEGSGLRSALSLLSGSKKKISVSGGKGKLPGKLTVNESSKKKLDKNFEDIKIKRNEDTIKRYSKADPNKMDWDDYVKLDGSARKARGENRTIKEKRNPGRGQTVNDYRNPQFKKGDHYNPVGKKHVSSRVYPDAEKTGTADQELNELYAQRLPYGNRTYMDKTVKGSWENQVKKVIKNARSARKGNGTNGKLRSDVYKDSPRQEVKKKIKAN